MVKPMHVATQIAGAFAKAPWTTRTSSLQREGGGCAREASTGGARRLLNRSGLTIIELMVVIAVILILVTITAPNVRRMIESARRAQARSEAQSIYTAISSYTTEYGRLPVSSGGQGGQGYTEYEDSEDIIRVLTGEDTTLNPREIMFLQPQSNDPDGEYLDPWGNQYWIVLDSSGRGYIEWNRIGRRIRTIALVAAVREHEYEEDEDEIIYAPEP